MKKLDVSLELKPQPRPGDPRGLGDMGDRFPTLNYSGPEELPIPDHGNMTVHYRITRKVEETEDGKDWYRCTIEIKDILAAEPVKDDRPSKRDTSAEDALDSLMKEKQESADDDDDDDEGDE